MNRPDPGSTQAFEHSTYSVLDIAGLAVADALSSERGSSDAMVDGLCPKTEGVRTTHVIGVRQPLERLVAAAAAACGWSGVLLFCVTGTPPLCLSELSVGLQ